MPTYIVLTEKDWTKEEVETSMYAYGCTATQIPVPQAITSLLTAGYDPAVAKVQKAKQARRAFECVTNEDINELHGALVFGMVPNLT